MLSGQTSSAVLSSTSNQVSVSTSPFKPSVGAPIAAATGNQWIENFKRANQGNAKEYTLQSKELKAILNHKACVGICLYFAIDETGKPHILPVGVDQTGRIIKPNLIRTQSGAINWETAQHWIANDLDPIDARFFGRNTFDRLFSNAGCLSIRAISAVDDSQKPQLLLADASLNYSSSSSVRYEDASSPCPPICVLSE